MILILKFHSDPYGDSNYIQKSVKIYSKCAKDLMKD